MRAVEWEKDPEPVPRRAKDFLAFRSHDRKKNRGSRFSGGVAGELSDPFSLIAMINGGHGVQSEPQRVADGVPTKMHLLHFGPSSPSELPRTETALKKDESEKEREKR